MKFAVLILNILSIIAFFPAVYFAFMSPMMFDSGATARTWTLFYTVIAIPISIIITQIISWILFFLGKYNWAFGISLIPVLVFLFLMG